MKTDEKAFNIQELKTKFSDLKSVQKAELRQFYLQRHPNLTEQSFRRILYFLEKQSILTPLGAGTFEISNHQGSSEKKKFAPAFSQMVLELSALLRESFPYTRYLVWENKILHEFMTHQPGQNQVILEVEKDACESVFNRLKEQYSGKIFLEPDRLTIERYVLDIPESIVLLRLLSQSPKIEIQAVPTARLEKILVDIFADEDRFFVFQGQELTTIFENAFSMYRINEKSLFRYAARRKIANQLRTFITTQTQIELSPRSESLE